MEFTRDGHFINLLQIILEYTKFLYRNNSSIQDHWPEDIQIEPQQNLVVFKQYLSKNS